MKAKWAAGLVVCAAIAAGTAYYFKLLPMDTSTTASLTPGSAKTADSKARAPAAPVMAASVVEADMPIILAAPGTVEPLAHVAIKTRVDGQIIEVLFAEGDFVKGGDLLFRLDDRMVRAQIGQAEAAIAKDQAALRDAEATFGRRQSLIGQKIVSEAALDQARFAVEGLKASIAAGQALLDTQRTQLDYLTIRAPISGRTGSLSAKVGAMVRGVDAAAPLVTINQTKPITVSFAVPQGDLPVLRRALLAQSGADIKIPSGMRPMIVPGKIAFIDNQVDKQTGSIVAKLVADNADEMLWPGLAVEVLLTVEVKPRMLSVPAAAVLPAQQGMITWVIGPENKVAPRVVMVDRIVGQTAYLSEGVKVGERVVIDGQIRLAPGTTVSIEEPRRAPPVPPSSEERRLNGRG